MKIYMLSGHRTATIVVPCFNEARRLRLDRFREYLRDSPDVAILFVNDGSRDETASLIRKFQAETGPQAGLLDSARNQGKAEAVRQGMLQALAQGVRFVGFWDADLATPLTAIPDFLELLEARPEIQMVFGARVKLLGRDIERRAVRHYLGRAFATCASIVLRLPVYDTQCGAKIFRVTNLLPGLLAEPFRSRWIFDVELIARFIRATGNAAEAGRGIYEFPLREWVDVAGSKVRPKDFVRAFGELAAIWLKYRT
ncbi:MAG TPA: glycosyltransferase [Bryobacteraceae bacterium]|nr:glycosyltransferase [Bryobacteraceae bacterium]